MTALSCPYCRNDCANVSECRCRRCGRGFRIVARPGWAKRNELLLSCGIALAAGLGAYPLAVPFLNRMVVKWFFQFSST